MKVKGKENVPTDEAVLICSNHISLLDCIFIGLSVKQQISYLGKSEIGSFKPFELFIKSLGFIPIKRGAGDLGAVKQVIDTVEKGRSVLVFVQGTRKKGVPVEETRAKNGTAFMQKKAGCSIVPVSLTNKKMKIGLFSRVNINIGKPITPVELEGMENDEITAKVFGNVIALSKEEI
jgi:1-acyl-sn-glycerol-3-phosphate acyltransferase